MAKGGIRPNSGRPKGSTTRPQIRDYFTEEEILDLVKDLKAKAKTDPNIAKFIAEHIFGKAIQPVEGDIKGELTITFDNAFTSTPETNS